MALVLAALVGGFGGVYGGGLLGALAGGWWSVSLIRRMQHKPRWPERKVRPRPRG